MQRSKRNERGTVIILCLILVVGMAALSAVFLGRTIHERNRNTTQSNSMKALFNAYGKLARAEAELGRAWYDPVTGRNLALLAALDEPDRMIGDTEVWVDPIGNPDTSEYFHLVAEDTVGRITRRVRALMTERENFANYNYFVNSHPLGISGTVTPRGSIHTNKRMDFYFANGVFVDAVTASEGFLYVAGATSENTEFRGPTNPSVLPVDDLMEIDVAGIQAGAGYIISDPALEAKVFLEQDQIRIQQFTKAGWVQVPRYVTQWIQVGEEEVEVTRQEPVYVTETYEEVIPIYEEQAYTWTETIPIYEEETYTWTETIPIYEQQQEERTRQVPVWMVRMVIEERTELVWVPDDDPDAIGGTAIAGGDGGTGPGHWEEQVVEYETTESYIDHYETETYYVTITVQVGEDYVEREGTRDVQVGEEVVEHSGTHDVQIGEEIVERTREVIDHYDTIVETVIEPIYEQITVESGTRWEYQQAEMIAEDVIGPNGIIYTAGDVIALEGTINGRVTIASMGTVEVTGSVLYVDAEGDSAYANGDDPDLPYTPNADYQGNSALGLIAHESILYTSSVPYNFELNASLIAKTGRVGITGINLDSEGEVSLASHNKYLKNSFRRLGGIITNLRPVSTYIDEDYVPRAGFLRGQSVFDRNLQFKPPTGFPSRRRPRVVARVIREVIG